VQEATAPDGGLDLAGVTAAVRRVVGARVRDRHLAQDLTQETLARLLEARPRLADEALLPYAVVTARNLVVSHVRSQARLQRHASQLVDPRAPDDPEDEVLRSEEAAAVAVALAELSAAERDVLVAHSVEGASTAELAEGLGSTPGGVAVQLARTRAKLRVGYVLALRRLELPTARCKPVLVALSAGDQRRQRALHAGRHLVTCPVCAELSEPLLERRRAIAGLLPLGGLGALLRRPVGWAREHPAQAGAGAAGAVAATVAVAVAVLAGPAVAPRPAPAPSAAPALAAEPSMVASVGTLDVPATAENSPDATATGDGAAPPPAAAGRLTFDGTAVPRRGRRRSPPLSADPPGGRGCSSWTSRRTRGSGSAPRSRTACGSTSPATASRR
jgi:RNA polymerase sigma factor (sigma-70 family)